MASIFTAIERKVRLILDKHAADSMAADAKKSLGGIDSALNKLGTTAKRIAQAIGLIWVTRKVVEFGEAMVKSAADAERIWNDLHGTIDAVGGSFDKMRGQLEATSAAFMDATIHSDEDFAQGLKQMITITGNVEASLKNMGLAANVAAQFFGGDLSQGVELVGKVANGVITPLQRMGIHVKTAAEGLQVLSERSFGAAERQTKTFSGQLAQLNNVWDNFKEEVGGAFIAANNGTSAIGLLSGAVKSMTAWVIQNKDELRAWITGGINAAITALRTLADLVKTIGIATGKLSFAPGIRELGSTKDELNQQLKWLATEKEILEQRRQNQLKALELAQHPGVVQSAKTFLGGPAAAAAAMKNTIELGFALQKTQDTLDQIDRTAAAAGDKLANFGKKVPPPTNGLGGTPTVVHEVDKQGAADEKKLTDDQSEALDRLSQSLRVARGMSQLLGEQFDLNKAQTEAVTSAIEDLLQAGMSPLDAVLQGLQLRLTGLQLEKFVREEVSPFSLSMVGLDAAFAPITVKAQALNDVTETLRSALQSNAAQAAIMGEEFDKNTADASAYETALVSLKLAGFADSDPEMQKYLDNLKKIRGAMGLAKEQASDYGTAVANLSSLIVGAIGGDLKQVAKAKAKENLLLAAEELAQGFLATFSLFGAVNAPKHFAAAAKFGSIAAGWAALGGSVGGGSTGGSSGAVSGAAGSSSAAASKTQPLGSDVRIYLTGPGFDAMNPQVQRVVYGALQNARERNGENARVTLVRSAR